MKQTPEQLAERKAAFLEQFNKMAEPEKSRAIANYSPLESLDSDDPALRLPHNPAQAILFGFIWDVDNQEDYWSDCYWDDLHTKYTLQ